MDTIANLTPESKVDSNSPGTAGSGHKATYKLSCSLCRSRKIKCDRVFPCCHCVRSGSECVFPQRKRMNRPRKTKNSELLNRISRLENIVGNVNMETLRDMDMSDLQVLTELKAQVVANEKPPAQQASSTEASTAPKPVAHEAQAAKSPEAKGAIHPSQYISGDFWTNLVGEVEGLKQALAQDTDSETEDESVFASPEAVAASKRQTFATQGLLAGYPSPDSAGPLLHPPAFQIQYLLDMFFDRVDPIVKILHRPTILKMVARGTSKLSPGQEALLFSIYFSAITSMSADECMTHFGQEQLSLFKHYQIEVERALAAADYLSNNELECLQSLLLYIACLRVHNESRASWVLTAMLLRLAQAYNLIQDGDGSHHTFFEAELRRRLWWQVVVLDIRASEDRGTEAMIDPDSYSTHLPLNINDEDFGPDTIVAPPERQGPTDITFSLCTAQSSTIFLWVGHAQTRVTSPTRNQSEDEIIAKAQALEQRFITNHDPNHFQSKLAAGLVRMINLKLWLMMQYPLHTRTNSATPAPRWPKVSREAILQTAVSVMELHEHKHNASKEGLRFKWWGATYVQWHPLAVALAELCAQTRGPLVERAWKIVQIVYPKWALVVADSKRGALWRPIRKLYKKAKSARAAAERQDEKDQVEAFQRLEYMASDGVGLPIANNVTMSLATSQISGQQALPQTTAGSMTIGSGVDGMNIDTSYAAPAAQTAAAAPVGPDGLPNLEIPSTEPLPFFTERLTGWPEGINFDMPMGNSPLGNTVDPLNWDVWNDFIDDTNADAGSRTGSSEGGL
ncbi:hypothetical protein G7054_g3525 [Neopestalotiopsis clavispora]|nr:hypothetical protein G7054_g3525 [Neopestalotiopsis clavispora]